MPQHISASYNMTEAKITMYIGFNSVAGFAIT